MDVNTSLQPLYPEDQRTSKGHKKETGALVKKKSAITWERMIKEQVSNFSLGICAENFHALDARYPMIKANAKLWVGPR